MRIEVVEVVPIPAAALVVCRTPVGQALVRWSGSQPPVRGHHHVEWTVDVDVGWGRNAAAAPVAAAGIRMDAETVVLRGRLSPQPDGAAVLDIGGTFVLLDFVGPVPQEAWNSWSELRASSGEVQVYPYEL